MTHYLEFRITASVAIAWSTATTTTTVAIVTTITWSIIAIISITWLSIITIWLWITSSSTTFTSFLNYDIINMTHTRMTHTLVFFSSILSWSLLKKILSLFWRASRAASSFANVTNPKPAPGRPVLPKFILTCFTCPNLLKRYVYKIYSMHPITVGGPHVGTILRHSPKRTISIEPL